MIVSIKRVPLEGDDAIRWLVLEGSTEDCPEATQRVTVDTASLAAGRITLDEVKSKLSAAVVDAATRYKYVQVELDKL